MLKQMIRILPVAAITLLAACGGNTETKTVVNTDSLAVDSLAKIVMNVHDEGMAGMMAIRRLSGRVVEVKDSLKAKKGDTTAYFQAAQLLDSANNAMNTWMHEYDFAMEGKSTAEKKTYLESEEKKITGVKNLMQESITGAKKLLKEE